MSEFIMGDSIHNSNYGECLSLSWEGDVMYINNYGECLGLLEKLIFVEIMGSISIYVL